MIGIYKITDKTNGLSYIGQSINIARRQIEHFNNNKYNQSKIDKAIIEKGADNFIFEIIEECQQSQLDEREKYWIKFYDTYNNGYNQTKGGQNEYCGHPKLQKEDVIEIRIAYSQHKNWLDIYQKYKDKISIDGFKHIWQGNRWKQIMPEVYTEENKRYYSEIGRFKKSENHINSKLTNQEVIKIRKRYMNETAKKIWEDYKDLYALGSFKLILQGIKYSNLPIYKKTEKKWINIEGYDEFN